jgi:uncharacterized protein (DUF362 family)
LELEKEFNARLIDLNQGDWVYVDVYDADLRPIKLRFSKTVADSSYRIVIGPPKTHDVVMVTLSIKNLAMGSLFYRVKKGSGGAARGFLRKAYHLLPSSVRASENVARMRDTAAAQVGGDKRRMHQGYPVHNLNLYLLTQAYPPHLSVIDGFEGMEGNGPELGSPVDWRVALASQDPVAVDCLCASLMGFDVADIGYLWYCSKKRFGEDFVTKLHIVGENVDSCRRIFLPHPSFEAQKRWRDDRINKILEI